MPPNVSFNIDTTTSSTATKLDFAEYFHIHSVTAVFSTASRSSICFRVHQNQLQHLGLLVLRRDSCDGRWRQRQLPTPTQPRPTSSDPTPPGLKLSSEEDFGMQTQTSTNPSNTGLSSRQTCVMASNTRDCWRRRPNTRNLTLASGSSS